MDANWARSECVILRWCHSEVDGACNCCDWCSLLKTESVDSVWLLMLPMSHPNDPRQRLRIEWVKWVNEWVSERVGEWSEWVDDWVSWWMSRRMLVSGFLSELSEWVSEWLIEWTSEWSECLCQRCMYGESRVEIYTSSAQKGSYSKRSVPANSTIKNSACLQDKNKQTINNTHNNQYVQKSVL